MLFWGNIVFGNFCIVGKNILWIFCPSTRSKDQAQDLIQDQVQDFFLKKISGILSEMGPYGSIWAHIKTGRSPMAHYHF